MCKIISVLTVDSRAEPYQIEHFSSQFGSARIIFKPYIHEREHWDPRFGSARARKFRAGRRFGSKMLGTVRYGSGMYGTGSPVCFKVYWSSSNLPNTNRTTGSMFKTLTNTSSTRISSVRCGAEPEQTEHDLGNVPFCSFVG